MIEVRHNIETFKARCLGFATYANLALSGTVEDILDFGELYMESIVPRGLTHRLAGAVRQRGPIVVEPGHLLGEVYVDPDIAPHAGFVDRGTGVDGPFHMPVDRRVFGHQRPMRFVKQGEGPKFRFVVKARPSQKIERSKNFSGRTHDAMRDYTRMQSAVLTRQLADYWTNTR